MDNYSVYMHICPNGKVYIGMTGQNVNDRWRNGKGYLNNPHFAQAIKKYKWENIEHIVIKTNLNVQEASNLEIELIKKYDSTNREKGYNRSTGGDVSSLGFHHTDEAKRKISVASKGRKVKKESIEKSRAARIKKVKIYDIDGNYIKTVESLTEAEKFTGVNNSNISGVCKGKYKQFKGYIFKYADDTTPVKKVRSHKKPVIMRTLDGLYITKFKSIKEASRKTNISDTHISDCCKGKYKQCGGYLWEYA